MEPLSGAIVHVVFEADAERAGADYILFRLIRVDNGERAAQQAQLEIPDNADAKKDFKT
jgi:hypothetical protein